MASQLMNDTSSRSHTILNIDVYQNFSLGGDKVQRIRGRLVLAVRRTTAKGIQLEEAKHINTSLSTLGNVISSLAHISTSKNPKDASTHIPYRSSKLTRVLTNSLGMYSLIVVLCTIGPSPASFHESVSTL
jgi:hypothetical protein